MTAATQPATPAAPNNNEPVRVNHTARNVIITIVVVAIIAVAAFFGYRAFAGANESSAKGSKGNPVKIGVVGATNPEWVKFKQDAEKAGIYVDIVDFQDYTSENPALDSGELDLNEFQHLLYLANYNVSNKKDLQPIGGTAIYPLGVYSTKVKDIKDLKQGDTVTIPNDETNQARAIGVLKAADSSLAFTVSALKASEQLTVKTAAEQFAKVHGATDLARMDGEGESYEYTATVNNAPVYAQIFAIDDTAIGYIAIAGDHVLFY